jgi:hypothetical protein
MRIFTLHFTLLLGCVLCSGCGSTLHMVSTSHLQRFDGGTRPVYVTNPELQPEYEILRDSGIYKLSSQREGARLVTLHPIRQYGRCANPLMLTMITFGIVPGVLPAARAFEYDLQADGVVEVCEHRLPLYERFSIWEWRLRGHEEKVMAEALAWSSVVKPGPH